MWRGGGRGRFGADSRASHSGSRYQVPGGKSGGVRTRRVAMMKIEVKSAVVVAVMVAMVLAADEHTSGKP